MIRVYKISTLFFFSNVPNTHNSFSEPDWFADMKRTSSGKQNSGRTRGGQPLNDNDSGLDLNDNFEKPGGSANSRGRHHARVQQPRGDDENDDIFGNMTRSPASAGRRKKMANFCHDCGTKYPIKEAKFCCECGLRRMPIPS